MKQNRNWKDVIDRIQLSGINQQQNLRRQNFERNLYVQKQLEDKIAETNDRKLEMLKQKMKEREYIEMKMKQQIEIQRAQKLKNRQKEQKLRFDNFEIMNKQKIKSESSETGNQIYNYYENPITANLFNKNLMRERDRKGTSKIYEQQNLKIAQGKLTQRIKQKNNNTEQQNMVRFHAEQDFRKRDQERQKFKARCLENGSVGLFKQNRSNQSLQKQYSYYLDQQIGNKQKGGPLNKSKTQKVEDILDGQLQKINFNPQQQSASPAYLGRIAYSYDRKKQLQYLDKQIDRQVNRHHRVKTQLPYGDSLGNKIIQLQINQKNPSYFLGYMENRQQGMKEQKKGPVSSRNYTENRTYSKLRSYKQMNIATGQIITKNYS